MLNALEKVVEVLTKVGTIAETVKSIREIGGFDGMDSGTHFDSLSNLPTQDMINDLNSKHAEIIKQDMSND